MFALTSLKEGVQKTSMHYVSKSIDCRWHDSKLSEEASINTVQKIRQYTSFWDLNWDCTKNRNQLSIKCCQQ